MIAFEAHLFLNLKPLVKKIKKNLFHFISLQSLNGNHVGLTKDTLRQNILRTLYSWQKNIAQAQIKFQRCATRHCKLNLRILIFKGIKTAKQWRGENNWADWISLSQKTSEHYKLHERKDIHIHIRAIKEAPI